MLGSFHQYPHYLKYKRRSSSSSLMSPLLPEHTVESEREKVGTAAGKKAAVKEGLRTLYYYLFIYLFISFYCYIYYCIIYIPI
jgi:hypothetical protein